MAKVNARKIAMESPNSKKSRREKDRIQHALKRANQNPQERMAKNAKDAERKRIKRNAEKLAKQKASKDIAPVVEEPKLSDIEKIRERNIAERKKLFEELKISQMKSGISNNMKYVEFLILSYCYDCINVINFI